MAFNKKQLEQLRGLLQPIVQRLDNIETKVDIEVRLKKVEGDIKEIKNT